MFDFKMGEKAQTIRAYREVFNSEAGRRVLYDLCKSCHVYYSTMDPNSHEMAYREGERSTVLRIMRTINIDPFELERQMKGQSEVR